MYAHIVVVSCALHPTQRFTASFLRPILLFFLPFFGWGRQAGTTWSNLKQIAISSYKKHHLTKKFRERTSLAFIMQGHCLHGHLWDLPKEQVIPVEVWVCFNEGLLTLSLQIGGCCLLGGAVDGIYYCIYYALRHSEPLSCPEHPASHHVETTARVVLAECK